MDLLPGLVVAHVGHFDPPYSLNRIRAKAVERVGANVHDQTAWLCAPGTEDGIARPITDAKADDGLRRRIAEQGHALFSRCFSIDSLARDVACVVLEALGRSAGKAIRRSAGDEAS